MAGYTKLFNSILASTIWRSSDKTRIVWITMLAMVNKDGIAEGSIPGLADMARVSIEDCEIALLELSSPDKYSRTSEHEGRRIEAVDGTGWRLLNHAKYREKMSADERREYNRKKQAEWREKHKPSKPVIDSQSQSAMSAHTASASDSHTDTDTDTTSTKEKAKENTSVAVAPATAGVWQAYEEAYKRRYQTAPVRNAKVNAILKNLLSRLAVDEAPQVAAYFLANNNSYYVQRGHAVDCLLRDAEKLRMEWATGRAVTSSQARANDKTAGNPALEILRDRGQL